MVPTWVQTIVLGIVQGLTEFIPVSSSGHLVLVPYLLGWDRPGLAFDVALHAGTATAVIAYFRRELYAMAKGVLVGTRGGRNPQGALFRRLALLLAVATVPVAIVGYLAMDLFERAFETPPVAASFLLVTALVLVVAEKLRTRRVRRAAQASARADDPAVTRVWTGDWVGDLPPETVEDDQPEDGLPVGDDDDDPDAATLEQLGLGRALVVGLAQVLALFPGMSRSGVTISAGMAAGLTREAATRFSFLLALPAMLGAFVLSAPQMADPGPYAMSDIIAGVVAATVAGYAAIAFLVRFVARAGLDVFARYLLVASALGWSGYAMIG